MHGGGAQIENPPSGHRAVWPPGDQATGDQATGDQATGDQAPGDQTQMARSATLNEKGPAPDADPFWSS